ncbi:hypothetical protein BDFB_013711, partial [Asbolus verrucosus]
MFLALGNTAALAARNYTLPFPWKRHPSVNVIRRLDQRLREQGQIMPNQKGIVPGRP